MIDADLIERFVDEYQNYHSISKGRRSDQMRAIDSLIRYAQVEEFTEVEPDHYVGWLGFLSNSELGPSTVKKYGMCVRPFFNWAFGVKLYSAENLMRIREAEFPKAPPRKPRPYSPKEIKRIWPALDKAHPLDTDEKYLKRWRRGTSKYKRIEHHAQHLQLRTVIRLALDAGLRRQEIFDISLDDMHYDNEFIVVREGKEGKFREVPYTKAGRAASREWIEFRTELKPKGDGPWLSLTRIGPEGVWRRQMQFRRFTIYLGDLGGDWQLHRLRHTCATNWLRAGMDIEVLSKMLGHASLDQTKEYVELVGVDMQKQVDKYQRNFEAQVTA